MITKQFEEQLLSRLNGRYVSSDDFLISSDKDEETGLPTVRIVYRYNQVFNLDFSIDDTYMLKFTPGKILIYEGVIAEDLENLYKNVAQWKTNVDRELEAFPLARKLNEQEAKIREIEELVKDYQDDNFKADEIEELKKRLDALQEKLEEKINLDLEKDDEKSQAIRELEKEISKLKVQSNVLTKKNWLLSFSTKMFLFLQRNPRVAKIAGASLYQSLPDGFREAIPQALVDSFGVIEHDKS